MARIITNDFRVDNARSFYNSFQSNKTSMLTQFQTELETYNANNSLALSNTDIDYITDLVSTNLDLDYPEKTYYIFASSLDNDADITNSNYDKREFLRRTIFGSKIAIDDIRYMLGKNDWNSGTIYDSYDDTKDNASSNVYVTVLDGTIGESPYRIYKCISNMHGGESTSMPTGTETVEFQLEDGYIWKFMFEVSAVEYSKYDTTRSLPYIENPTVISAAVNGISNILIESTTAGIFLDYLLGDSTLNSYTVDESNSEKYYMRVSTTNTPKTTNDFYAGMYLYFPNGGNAKIYDITESSVPVGGSSSNVVDLSIETSDDVSTLLAEGCRIYPKVKVSKGEVTDCIAYADMDTSGTITDIVFYQRGEGYNFAEAEMSIPNSLIATQDDFTLRTVVSPTGGHGADPVLELDMSRIMIVANFVTTDDEIPTSGTYSKIGLVVDPQFANSGTPSSFDNRMVLTVDSYTTSDPNIQVGSVLYQIINDEFVSGIIHQIDGTTIYLVDYVGSHKEDLLESVAFVKPDINSETYSEVTINSITINETEGVDANYVVGTGELLHFINFDAITRTSTRSEKIKLIFDF